MRAVVNGEPRELAEGTTVAQLLEQLGLVRRGIAVAVNDGVVPGSAHAQQPLHDGDRVEIIVAVAGG